MNIMSTAESAKNSFSHTEKYLQQSESLYKTGFMLEKGDTYANWRRYYCEKKQ